MRNSLKHLMLLLLFSLSTQLVNAQLSVRLVPLPAVSNFVPSADCFPLTSEIITAELVAADQVKAPSRTFCRVFFNEYGEITDVKVRSQNADPIVKELIASILAGASYCWAQPDETKETVFQFAFAVRVE